MGLRRFLAAETFDARFRAAPVIAQFSSMGSLSAKWLQEFETSLSAGGVTTEGPNGALRHPQEAHMSWSAPGVFACSVRASSHGRGVAILHSSPLTSEHCPHTLRPCPQSSRRQCSGRPRWQPMGPLACSWCGRLRRRCALAGTTKRPAAQRHCNGPRRIRNLVLRHCITWQTNRQPHRTL